MELPMEELDEMIQGRSVIAFTPSPHLRARSAIFAISILSCQEVRESARGLGSLNSSGDTSLGHRGERWWTRLQRVRQSTPSRGVDSRRSGETSSHTHPQTRPHFCKFGQRRADSRRSRSSRVRGGSSRRGEVGECGVRWVYGIGPGLRSLRGVECGFSLSVPSAEGEIEEGGVVENSCRTL